MKGMKFGVIALAALLLVGCNANNKVKGGLIGGGGGALLGAIVGKLAGNTAVGTAIGGVVGAGAGVLIGNHMDKVKQAAQQVENAQVEEIKDKNGLTAVKATFDAGILFRTSSAELSPTAKSALNKFAQNVLNKYPDVDVDIQGYTDNTGWKNCNAEQSRTKNMELSAQRAFSVESYLKSCGVNGRQFKNTQGYGEANPVGDNSTASGRDQNRRVEIYMYASQEMVNAAQNGTLR